MPARFRTPKILSWVLIFSFAFFIPAVGLVHHPGWGGIGYLAAGAVSGQTLRIGGAALFFPRYRSTARPVFRQIDLKSLLTTSRAPNALRVQGMLVLKDMPAKVTGNLLRHTLGDSFEDLRLLAYGILDQKEKEITRDIERALHLLERAKESTPLPFGPVACPSCIGS